MPAQPTNSVRLVIQYVPDHGSSQANYVVTVYPGPRNSPFQSMKFPSREELAQRLRAAIPGFDEGQLLGTRDTPQIVFAETMQLSDAQILALGSE